MTKSILMVGDTMTGAALAEALEGLETDDIQIEVVEDVHIGQEIPVGLHDSMEMFHMPIIEFERPHRDDFFLATDSGFGRQHRLQRAAGEGKAEILVETRQQRRAAARQDRKKGRAEA